ncbi:MAG: HipA domain-containing protein [Lautropia sp.]|nr:HipA domain-containing protein [Lautropia sp.]
MSRRGDRAGTRYPDGPAEVAGAPVPVDERGVPVPPVSGVGSALTPEPPHAGRALRAFINGVEVGLLQEQGGLWRFSYAPGWLASPQGFALSPWLPLQAGPLVDGASERPVQWYFDNLLPEEGQRTLMARDAGVGVEDAFGLLQYYGAESAGSLTLLPPDVAGEPPGRLRPLSHGSLEGRIGRLPRVALTQDALKRMSLAGAQHKLALVLEGDALFEPQDGTPSTHVLKPDHPDADYPHSVINEFFVMRLAARLGLPVPPVHRLYVPSPVYLVERFDRVRGAAGWQRRHVVDACQLLGLDRSFKYSQGSIERLAELAALCRSPLLARTQLFSWLLFNVLVGNGDAHLKNLSFLVSDEGIQLAPFYDLLSVAAYETPAFDQQGWPAHTQLAWPILGVRHFSGITHALLLEAAHKLGLPPATAARLLDDLVRQIVPQADELLNVISRENEVILHQQPTLANRLAGEMRCLRVIRHTILPEMLARVRAG